MADNEEPAEAPGEIADYTIDELTQRLAPFLGRNPATQLEAVPKAGDLPAHIRLTKPWGDPTLWVLLAGHPDELIATLNRLLLPAKFSAIWHVETSVMEVIWTAGKLAAHQEEIVGRKFTLTHNGRSYTCRFGDSSADLLTLANRTFPDKGTSETNLRNISTFFQYKNLKPEDHERYGIQKPLSFWIEGYEGSYDEEAVVELARRVNFFLTYYDRRSPSVIIHTDTVENGALVQPVRYIDGTFPDKITAPDIDETLLAFWSAANNGNEILRFMLYWRIMEYAAFHFMDSTRKGQLKKLLAGPAVAANLDEAVAKIAGIVSGTSPDDAGRLIKLLGAAVEVEVIWQEIDANRASFQSSVLLDGGYTIEPLISDKETLETFRPQGITKLAGVLRGIRNCLSHGKDIGSAGVITPTVKNQRALRPWVHIAARLAGEVVLYKDIT